MIDISIYKPGDPVLVIHNLLIRKAAIVLIHERVEDSTDMRCPPVPFIDIRIINDHEKLTVLPEVLFDDEHKAIASLVELVGHQLYTQTVTLREQADNLTRLISSQHDIAAMLHGRTTQDDLSEDRITYHMLNFVQQRPAKSHKLWLTMFGCNYLPNATNWKAGDYVLHDKDAKTPAMLMMVHKTTPEGVQTTYISHSLYQRHGVLTNRKEVLHDPALWLLDWEDEDKRHKYIEQGFSHVES